MTRIHTQRLMLRPVHKRDASRFVKLCSDILIARNTARVPHPYGIKDAEKFVRFAEEAFASDKEYPFAVCRNDEIVACAGVAPKGGGVFELGYWVGADYRGEGLATEAAAAVAHFAVHKRKAREIVAGYFTDNPASGRVLEKIGLTPTGEIVKMYSVGRGCEDDVARVSVSANNLKRDFKITYG